MRRSYLCHNSFDLLTICASVLPDDNDIEMDGLGGQDLGFDFGRNEMGDVEMGAPQDDPFVVPGSVPGSVKRVSGLVARHVSC